MKKSEGKQKYREGHVILLFHDNDDDSSIITVIIVKMRPPLLSLPSSLSPFLPSLPLPFQVPF